MNIPLNRHVQCEFCKCDLDREDRNTYRRGAGWIKGRVSKGGGAHGIALIDWSSRYSCKWCIDKMTHHIPIGQERLFDFTEE
jgi:hypothetical protein